MQNSLLHRAAGWGLPGLWGWQGELPVLGTRGAPAALEWEGTAPLRGLGTCGISKCLSLIPGGLLRIYMRLGGRFKGLPAVGSAEENVAFPLTAEHTSVKSEAFGVGVGLVLCGAGVCWEVTYVWDGVWTLGTAWRSHQGLGCQHGSLLSRLSPEMHLGLWWDLPPAILLTPLLNTSIISWGSFRTGLDVASHGKGRGERS